MPLYPLPAIVALAGWSLAFASTGTAAIAFGLGWLAVGAVVFLIAARKQRWWPFLALLVISLFFRAPALRRDSGRSWSTWNTSRVTAERGYPVFTVDGKPFFVYGAAFFYERIPRERWRATLPHTSAWASTRSTSISSGTGTTPSARRAIDFTGAHRSAPGSPRPVGADARSSDSN